MRISDIRAKECVAIAKGLATFVPPLNWFRIRVKSGGATENPRYCYALWLRHLCMMRKFGWHPAGKRVCELGPGNSIGAGIAALFSGVESYAGLDAFPYSFVSNRAAIAWLIREIANLYAGRRRIPGPEEFPRLHPELDDYTFPSWLLKESDPESEIRHVEEMLLRELDGDLPPKHLKYLAPYQHMDLSFFGGSFDAVFSQAVLEHVQDLGGIYRLSFALLKPQSWSWHVVDFRCHALASDWNGHWSYPEWLWRIVRGKREFLLNRQPLSKHLEAAEQAGFVIRTVVRYKEGDPAALGETSRRTPDSFAVPFRGMSCADASTLGSLLILQKA